MTQDDPHEQQALEAQDRIATMSDKELKAAYEATDGTPGDPWTDFLAQAMNERGIDF
jgi:hypothetical protein